MRSAVDPRLRLLLDILDACYVRRGWHGTTLKGALRGVSPAEALWRPKPGRHNIWELALHMAYWKYCVRRRLLGDRAQSFGRPGSNWPRLPNRRDARTWKADLALLELEHQRLKAAVASFPVHALGRRRRGARWTAAEEIHGVAAHDAYHTGQIQLLKRLHSTRSAE
jgi:hypothetical protein